MTFDALDLLLLLVVLVGAAFAYWKWGWRGAVAVAGGFLGLALLFLHKRRSMRSASPLPPLPDSNRGVSVVTDTATHIVVQASEKERAVIQEAAKDADTLAAKIRSMK